MADALVKEFEDGVDAYWAGELPDNWNDPETRAKSPFITGWYMASMWETSPGWLLDSDGQPFQEEDE
jgi:hypothetical protein